MAFTISFIRIVFLKSILYQNCITDNTADCRYWEFSIEGMSSSTIDRCSSQPKNLYMGPYGEKTKVSKTFTNLQPNKQLEFSISIWKFDSWDSEGVEITANNLLLKNAIFTDRQGTKICRNGEFEDLFQPLKFKFQTTGTALTISLKDNFDQSSWDESWGFRDFIIEVIVPCVKFYSECNYTGTVFQICQGDNPKKQTSIPYEIKSILMDPGIIVKIKGPNYFSGVLQVYTNSQLCLNGFKFPKYINPT
ncbi:unnamed protein product [Paramecium primaurelia]|uniref:Uncharacterized protein n=1 Tax=Paramecium primaurelia TaxID=5886 RepID=A0A8S1P009_PARPR|nr:unnamed protein product [Paramecium primaurelia]